MIIYLAGGITGNLKDFWQSAMKVYLAGTMSREFVIEETMKVYLAGGNIGWEWSGDYNDIMKENKPYILESYYYLRSNNDWILKMRPFFKDFLLDSGAFTFMSGNGGETDWDKYTEEYAEFIVKHDVEHFFELDIDSLVGITEVERLRNKLETLTNKRCIPVWHKSRGLHYWKKMCKEYDYIAIGGIVTKEIKRSEYPVFGLLLKIARGNNCRVHGLGFTSMAGLKKYPFYSVDSTSWLNGNRFGYLYKFNGEEMKQIHGEGRLVGRPAAIHNFREWIKFSQYAENNL